MDELISLALRRAGAKTLAEFQTREGLPVTGEADQATRLALEPYWLGYRTVILQPGDSFWRLAQAYGTTVVALETANPNLDPTRLQVGARVTVPLGFPVVPTNVPMTAGLCSYCIRGLVARYPFLRTETLTTTAFGRPVETLTLGRGPRRVLYTAAHHANEWITAPLLLAFAEALAQAVAQDGVLEGRRARDLTAAATIYMVPMVNPDGVDLVTEGVLTLNRVLQLLRRYVKNETVSEEFFEELDKPNGGSMVAKVLIEDWTDVHLFVGKAINSAYQNPGLPFDLGIRQNLVEQLKHVIEEMGKTVTITYY